MPSRNVRARPLSWRISQDKRVNDLQDPWAMLTYTWLIPSADNLGRMEGDPDLVSSMIFPRKQDVFTKERMASILRMLHDAGLVYWYMARGECFLQFPPDSWSDHQKLVGNMKAESDFPAPDETAFQEWVNGVRNQPLSEQTGIYGFAPVRNEGKGREGEEKGREVDEDVAPEGKQECMEYLRRNMTLLFTNTRPDLVQQLFGLCEDVTWPVALKGAQMSVRKATGSPVNYFMTVLENWKAEGLTTLEAVEQRAREYKQRRKDGSAKQPHVEYLEFPEDDDTGVDYAAIRPL